MISKWKGRQMTDDKKWPPQDEDREGPTAEQVEDKAIGNTEYVGGGTDETDAAGAGDPQPGGSN